MPKTCPQCQSEAADGAAFCPSCGAPLDPTSAPAPAAPTSSDAPAPPVASGSSLPAYKFNASRWSKADWIAGIATVVLFISLFLSWFGVSVIGVTVTASGLSAHGFLYVVMIICILELAYLALRAGWDRLPVDINLPHLTVMLIATLVNLVLVFIAFIDKPGGSGVGWEFGAVLALIAAVVAAAPYAIPQLRAKTM